MQVSILKIHCLYIIILSLSKNNVSKNPDSSLVWADLAIKIASKTNNLQLMADAAEQKKFVQESNAERIKKQDDNFKHQDTSHYNSSALLITVTILLFIACIYLSVLYRRKNNAL